VAPPPIGKIHAWKKFVASPNRAADDGNLIRVSAPIPARVRIEAWMLKQVQHDAHFKRRLEFGSGWSENGADREPARSVLQYVSTGSAGRCRS